MPPEYLAPGVYVEESDAEPRSIEGVSTSTAGFTGVYAHEMTLPAYRPEWTDPNRADPGITLVELLAWLTEAVLYRRGGRPDARAANIAVFVSTGPLDGKRLVVTLENLQRIACHGVAEGLAVESPGTAKSRIDVDPGSATDNGGRELEPGGGGPPGPSQRTGVRRKEDR